MKHRLALLLGALTLVLAGCGGSGLQGATGESDQGGRSQLKYALPDGIGSGKGDGVFPRTIAHYAGQTTIPSEPKRVIVTVGGQIDSLLVLGKIPVGATQAKSSESGQLNSSGLVPGFLQIAFPELAGQMTQVRPMGTREEPDFEQIALAEPDLILTNSRTDPTVTARYQDIAPTVVTLGGRVDWTEDFLLIADTLGAVDAGRDYIDDYQSRVDDVSGKIDHSMTVSTLRFRAQAVEVYTTESFCGSVLAAAGVARPDIDGMDGDKFDISPETLKDADADVIFYSAGDGSSEANLKRVEGSDLWQGLRAVTGGRAQRVDDAVWYAEMGPTSARLILDTLAQELMQ